DAADHALDRLLDGRTRPRSARVERCEDATASDARRPRPDATVDPLVRILLRTLADAADHAVGRLSHPAHVFLRDSARDHLAWRRRRRSGPADRRDAGA